LRDGAQTQGVDFSVEDKNTIARELDELGVDYIEGGWPGANPTDTAFFSSPPTLQNAKLTAFGMTKRSGRSAARVRPPAWTRDLPRCAGRSISTSGRPTTTWRGSSTTPSPRLA